MIVVYPSAGRRKENKVRLLDRTFSAYGGINSIGNASVIILLNYN